MTAVGLLNIWQARRLLWMMDLAGAVFEALKGARSAFDPLIAATRLHPGRQNSSKYVKTSWENLLPFLKVMSNVVVYRMRTH